MRLAYPAQLREGQGAVRVSFPDVPEALTEGNSVEEALHEATDCLVAALGGYVQAGRSIPHPSQCPNAPLVKLPALVAAKVALYDAMCSHDVAKAELAQRIGVSESTVERLVDLDRPAPIGEVEEALHALGSALCVEVSAM